MKPFLFCFSLAQTLQQKLLKSGSIPINLAGNPQFFRSSWCEDCVIVLLLSACNCLSTISTEAIIFYKITCSTLLSFSCLHPCWDTCKAQYCSKLKEYLRSTVVLQIQNDAHQNDSFKKKIIALKYV